MVGADDVLRVQWWEANDALKAAELALRPANTSLGTGCEAGGCNRTACDGSCVGSGLWLEGTIAAGEAATGIWLQTATGGGFAFTASTVDPANMTFALGATPTAAAANASWVTHNKTAGGPDIIDRAMVVPSSQNLTWRLVARNAWSGQGMVEWYVNDVMSLPFTVGSSLTGAFEVLIFNTHLQISIWVSMSFAGVLLTKMMEIVGGRRRGGERRAPGDAT